MTSEKTPKEEKKVETKKAEKTQEKAKKKVDKKDDGFLGEDSVKMRAVETKKPEKTEKVDKVEKEKPEKKETQKNTNGKESSKDTPATNKEQDKKSTKTESKPKATKKVYTDSLLESKEEQAKNHQIAKDAIRVALGKRSYHDFAKEEPIVVCLFVHIFYLFAYLFILIYLNCVVN